MKMGLEIALNLSAAVANLAVAFGLDSALAALLLAAIHLGFCCVCRSETLILPPSPLRRPVVSVAAGLGPLLTNTPCGAPAHIRSPGNAAACFTQAAS
jgi:hypothetical protein